MWKRAYITALLILLCSGCSYSIKEINTSHLDPACVRECSKTYSDCVKGGPAMGSKFETLRACKEAYEICTGTCPAK
jgi:hypothetical protein